MTQAATQICLLANRTDAIRIVAGWWYDEWGDFQPQKGLDDWAREIHDNLSHDQLPVHVIAVAGRQVLGAAMLKDHEMRDKFPDLKHWLGNVYVAPAARGRGVAARLAAAVIRIAQDRGIPELYLQTRSLDGGLYRALGWEPRQQVHHAGHEVCVMSNRIQPQGQPASD